MVIDRFNEKSIFKLVTRKNWASNKQTKLNLGVTVFIAMITGKPTNLRTNRRQGIANRKSSR